MIKIISSCLIMILLFSGVAYSYSDTYFCTSCGQTFYFDPDHDAYRESWSANHYAQCSGTGSGGTSNDYAAVPETIEGYMFLGGLMGATLGGLYGYAYAPPDALYYAAAGAFAGAVALGLLWIVSTE